MRIFDLVNRREVSLRATELVRPMPTDAALTESSLRQAVRQCVRVTADECQTWIAAAWEPGWDLATKCGPLRLPFPSMWIEWTIPAAEGVGVSVRNLDPSAALPVAAWFESTEPPDWAPAGAVQMLKCLLFAEPSSTKLIYVPSMLIVFTGEYGEYLGMQIAGKVDLDAPEVYTSMFVPGLLAIGLMNCRNVKIAEACDRIRSPKRTKTDKAKAPKPLVYHTITLPGGSRPKNVAEAHAIVGGSLPWHIVRGHFKTYTAESPLMGKYVGTYWWQPTIRGKHDDGVVEKDYRVVPPACE